jgi:hypothetical protein
MAQLDLVAGPPLRETAGALVRHHESMRHYIRLASGASDWFDRVTDLNNEIGALQGDLVVKTRADLGLDHGEIIGCVRSRGVPAGTRRVSSSRDRG